MVSLFLLLILVLQVLNGLHENSEVIEEAVEVDILASLVRKLLFAREDSSFFWAVFSGLYGLLFGPLCAIPYFFIGFAGGGLQQGLTQMFSWWVAGIPFDIIHGISNFVIMLALYRPIHTLLERIPGVPER